MGNPVHGSHLQPSDIGALLPFASTERLTFSKQAILIAGIFGRWVAPGDGLLEDGWFTCAVCGTGAGPNTMDIKVNGTSILTALMSIAHDDADGTVKWAAFDTTAVVRGDVVTFVSSAGATNQTQASAGVTFRLLGS